MEPEAAGIDPLLIIQAQCQSDRQLRLSLDHSLSLLCKLFTCVEPLERRNNYFEGTTGTFKFSNHFSAALLISSCETDFLNRSIIETLPTNHDACTTDLWSEVRLDGLDLHIIIAEIDWFSCELLAIKRNIHCVYHIVRIIAYKFGHFSDDFSVLIKSFSTGPRITNIIKVKSRVSVASVINRLFGLA